MMASLRTGGKAISRRLSTRPQGLTVTRRTAMATMASLRTETTAPMTMTKALASGPDAGRGMGIEEIRTSPDYSPEWLNAAAILARGREARRPAGLARNRGPPSVGISGPLASESPAAFARNSHSAFRATMPLALTVSSSGCLIFAFRGEFDQALASPTSNGQCHGSDFAFR
jgi:hypothetical protein